MPPGGNIEILYLHECASVYWLAYAVQFWAMYDEKLTIVGEM